MSAKDLKALTRRLIEEENKGKAATTAAIDKFYATDIVVHSSVGVDIRGLKDFKQYYSESYDAFSDAHLTIDDIIVEADKVAIRYTMTGTHKGKFMGIPPTNKKVTMWGINIARIAGGKIVEAWERSDTLGMMQQLGLVPTPGKGK
jgi:steroid delta-isomerase-like uncharacterized protein